MTGMTHDEPELGQGSDAMTQAVSEPEVLNIGESDASASAPNPWAAGAGGAPPPRGGLLERVFRLRSNSPVLTYIGIGLSAIGFVLIAYTWGRVAGLTNVSLQLPYLVSGGLTGLGFIIVGVTVINGAAKLQEAADRERQIQQLTLILRELRTALGTDDDSEVDES